MMKATHVQLKLLLYLILFLLNSNICIGGNIINKKISTNVLAIQHSNAPLKTKITLPFLSIKTIPVFDEEAMMADTACTSIIRDTFFVNTTPKTNTYNWTIPPGAIMVENIGDTMIVLDWTNAVPGLVNICVEAANNCGASDPVCFPILILICNDAPFAVNDSVTTMVNVPIFINNLNNDSDPNGDILTNSFDPSNTPTNGTVTIIGSEIYYIPNSDFTGSDDFNYIICDNGNPFLCDTATVSITILSVPPSPCTIIPTPTLLSNGKVCYTEDIYLFTQENYTSTTIESLDSNYQFVWFNGLGDTIKSTSESNLRISANSPQAISPFTVQVNLGNCKSNFANPIVVNIIQLPTISASISNGNNEICKNSSVQLLATSLDNVSYEWRLLSSNVIISTVQNPTFSNIHTNTAYSLTVRNNLCANNYSIDTVSVIISPALDFEPSKVYAINMDCSPSNLVLNANIVGNSADLAFRWTGPNAFISTNKNPEINSVSEAFNGTYSLEITDKNGCIHTKTLFVNDIQGTIPRPIITSQDIGCTADNIILEVPTYVGSGIVYNWFRNGNLIGLNNTNQLIIDSLEIGARYTVSIKIGGCMVESDTFLPIVYDHPSVSIANPSTIACSNGLEEFTLSTTISGGQTPYDISWSGPNGFKSFNENPSFININSSYSGVYTIEIIDKNGCKSQASTVVEIMDAPLQPVISSQGSACEGEQIILSAPQYDGANTSYLWQVPNNSNVNGLNSNELIISSIDANLHTGDYTLTVIVNDCQVSSEIFNLNLSASPIINPEAIYTQSIDCASNNLTLKANIIGAFNDIIYSWTGPNGYTSNLENPIIKNATVANNGQYKLTVSNNKGCSVSGNTIFIENIKAPLPQPIIQSSELVCEGGLMTLTSPLYTEPKVNYSWQLNGKTIFGENSNILNIGPLSDEDNQYQLIVQIEACTLVSNILALNILDVPHIEPAYTLTSICEGGDLQLSANISNEIGNIDYNWTGPNGYTSHAKNPIITKVNERFNGTYSLSIKTITGCETNSSFVIKEITNTPDQPTVITNSPVCIDGIIQLSIQKNPESYNAKFVWLNGNRDTIGTNRVLSLAANDALAIPPYLAEISNNGCPSVFSVPVQVTVLSVSTEIMTTNNSSPINKVCEGEAIQLSIPFYEGATYNWFGPAGYTSDKYNPSINPASIINAGEYFATVNIEGCGSIISSSTQVYINATPTTPTIINNSPVCLGESVTLEVSSTINNSETDDIQFNWHDAISNALIAKTKEPILKLENYSINQSKEYYVQLSINGCLAPPSNISEIQVLSPPELNAFAGIDQTHCAIEVLDLQANEEEGTGIWTSPTGAELTNPNSANTQALNLKEGINQFVWTITSDICGIQSTDTVEIKVDVLTNDKAFAGLDKELCEITTTNLNATELNQAVGVWTQSENQTSQGIIILEPSNPKTAVEGLKPGNTFTFTWSITQGVCANFDSDDINLTISDILPNNAVVKDENIILCQEDQLALSAEIPIFSIGRWLTSSSATIADPMSPSTYVENLDPGKNVFIWTLSNGACINYSTDTLNVYSEELPMANSDTYGVKLNESLTFDVLENDDFILDMNYDFIITKYPENGEITENEAGIITYQPKNNFFGFDNFRYKLCSQICEELCDTALVTLEVGVGAQATGECLIPNIISPNNDGNNDFFNISCIDFFDNNQLKIFNRWGDKVYDVINYQNDWQGTFKDQPLPPGTYFYLLQLGEKAEPIQGFITIFR